jgi:hypothetical protein
MYNRLGESRKAVAHAKRARSLRFGAVPPVEVSLSLEAYTELAASRKRDTQLTDSHGGHWVAMSSGAMGVLMKQKEPTLPETHPLHGIGPSLLLKIVTTAPKDTKVTKVTKVTKATEGTEGPRASKVPRVATDDDKFIDEDTSPESPPVDEPVSVLFPEPGSVDAEFAMMSRPELRNLVPAVYCLVVVGGTAVGYSIERFAMSLKEHIYLNNGMDEDMERKVYRVIEGVCAVVSCFDVKPENFVVSSSGDVRMIDFGSDFCTSRSEPKPKDHILADVTMCTLIFCLSACGKDEKPLPLPFLTRKLLDGEHRPLDSARTVLGSLGIYYPNYEETIYTRAISSLQMQPCYQNTVVKSLKHRRGNFDYNAIDLLNILVKRIKKDELEKAGFGRELREPQCAIL